MKRFLSAGFGALALIAAVPASAADLPRGVPYRAPGMVMSVYNWTGIYVGVHGGGGWASSGGIGMEGWFLGAQIGYNWQPVGSPWVFGIELDSAWADMGRTDTYATSIGTLSAESEASYTGSLRPRIGYAWDRTMLYLTGGLAWMSNRLTVNSTLGGFTAGLRDTQTHFGGAIGAGAEHAFAPYLSGKLEYLYTAYGSETYFNTISGGTSADAGSHTLKVGLNYHFR
jgi:outer membrane immunogenic protein